MTINGMAGNCLPLFYCVSYGVTHWIYLDRFVPHLIGHGIGRVMTNVVLLSFSEFCLPKWSNTKFTV